MNFKTSALGLATLLVAGNSIAAPAKSDLIKGYADLAFYNYQDALVTAKALESAVENLVNKPSDAALTQAKAAWLAARPSYQQSEVFRFSNPVVDDWEGQLNAWPLDEGLIDYVQTDLYQHELGNDGAVANIVANSKLTTPEGELDSSVINADFIASLNEFAGSEANVASGYHAIEFLLWGQDLNGFNAGAGNRPWTDYAQGADCTNQHCDRRGEYLNAAADLLVSDLEYMVEQWQAKVPNNYRQTLLAESAQSGLNKMLYGMGSLSLGELAGERIKVALQANSTEDEHDCFSDNTHNSHYFNAQGVANLYFGQYGEHKVASIRDYLLLNDQLDLVKRADDAFLSTKASMTKIVQSANNGMAFDQLIAPQNKAGHQLLNQSIQDLVAQTAIIEEIAKAVGIDSLSPDTADHEF